MRKTFFIKSFLSYASVTLFALFMASMVFFHQISRYALQEKQAQIQQVASNVAEQTEGVLSHYSPEYDKLYQLMLLLIAQDSDVSILITDVNGKGLLRADERTVARAGRVQVSSSIFRAFNSQGEYREHGTLADALTEMSYVYGTRVSGEDGQTLAFVFVSATGNEVSGIRTHVMNTFIMIVSGTLIGILILSYFISSLITRPLHHMAQAAKSFALGDFSVRVSTHNQCDEIDELAIAFNNMAITLEKLEELTSGFIANVSHEFKTPMTTIGGFVDGMIDGTIPPQKYRPYLHIISEEVHRLSRMVMRMLDATKIQSGDLTLHTAPFDFSEMASQIILSFEKKIEEKQVEVDVQLEDSLMVLGDKDHLFRAIYNLVDNAVKFVNKRGKLTLVAKKEGNVCAFLIRNTGETISAEELPHVFGRFYKTDASRSYDKTGAGLGLYIVKNIINLHGGEVTVHSQDGYTEFACSLPLASKKMLRSEEFTKRS